MRIALATLCLNEAEWLPSLYEQHKNWPGLVSWVFVESADVLYAKSDPTLVDARGLSTDSTSAILSELELNDSRVKYIPHGWCGSEDSAQGKCQARSRYLEHFDEVKPDIVIVVDADEFYTFQDQEEIIQFCEHWFPEYSAMLLKQRHVWNPPCYPKSRLFREEVVRAYWSVPHTRVWRWIPGMRYIRNHNWPEINGRYLNKRAVRLHVVNNTPQCVHLGYASSLWRRGAKHQYYKIRGEGVSDGRQMYVDCRTAFENFKPGGQLPHGALIIPYEGPIPEVFKNGSAKGTSDCDLLQPSPQHEPDHPSG